MRAIGILLFTLFLDLPAQQLAPLVGTVVDAEGAPVKDATVVVSRGAGRGFSCLDLELRRSWRQLARAHTSVDGRFGFQLPLGLFVQLVVDVEGYAICRREDLVPGDEVRIELGPPCVFAGQLRDAAGNGTPGRLRGWDPNHITLFDGRTDAEGNFSFDRLPSSSFQCDIEPDVAMAPPWFEGELYPMSALHRIFNLDEGTLLRGRVTDATTGAPIPGARIGEGWTLHKAATCGAGGRYELLGSGQAGRSDFYCAATGYVTARARPGSGPGALDFVLQRGARVTGIVQDGDGRPVEGVYAAAVTTPGAGDIVWVPGRTGVDGSFVCDGLPSMAGGSLLLRCDGFATAVYHWPVADRNARIDLGEIRMQAPRLVRGILRDAAGRPRGDVMLSLRGVNADADRLGPVPVHWHTLLRYLGARRTRTDARGAFAFGDVAPGSYALDMGRSADGKGILMELEVEAGVDPEPIELRL